MGGAGVKPSFSYPQLPLFTACTTMPASSRSTPPWQPRNGSHGVRVSASRAGAGDMGLATGSGWGSQPEAGLSGHGLGPASVPLLEGPPQWGGGRWGDREWRVPRAQQRPGSNPEHRPCLLQGQGKSPFRLLGLEGLVLLHASCLILTEVLQGSNSLLLALLWGYYKV